MNEQVRVMGGAGARECDGAVQLTSAVVSDGIGNGLDSFFRDVRIQESSPKPKPASDKP